MFETPDDYHTYKGRMDRTLALFCAASEENRAGVYLESRVWY